jgi:hypothetical protein
VNAFLRSPAFRRPFRRHSYSPIDSFKKGLLLPAV